MSDFTYEKGNEKRVFETWEWDSNWIEYAYENDAKRILYIGDSISCNSRKIITAKSDKTLLVDGFGTSKALDNPWFYEGIRFIAKQEPQKRVAIMFNNGLHGWHLEDETEYKYHYEKMVDFLLNEFTGIPLFILLTTCTNDEDRNKRVVARNKIAEEIAKKHNLPVIDLYTLIKNNISFLSSDGVHLSAEGNECFAEEILKNLRKHNI